MVQMQGTNRHTARARSSPIPARLRLEGGVTLITLMIGLAVGSIVLGGIYTTFSMQANAYLREQQLVDVQQTVRLVKSMMIRDLQRAGYNPTRAGFSGVTGNATLVQIQADLDGDTSTTGQNENITYSYDAGSSRLLRNSGAAQTQFPNIQAFTATYLDDTGSTTTVPANIRHVHLSITVRTALSDPNYPLNGGYRSVTFQFRVAPRNLAL